MLKDVVWLNSTVGSKSDLRSKDLLDKMIVCIGSRELDRAFSSCGAGGKGASLALDDGGELPTPFSGSFELTWSCLK